VTSFKLLSKYMLIMRLRFDVMLHSNFGNENSCVGRRFPTPALTS